MRFLMSKWILNFGIVFPFPNRCWISSEYVSTAPRIYVLNKNNVKEMKYFFLEVSFYSEKT